MLRKEEIINRICCQFTFRLSSYLLWRRIPRGWLRPP